MINGNCSSIGQKEISVRSLLHRAGVSLYHADLCIGEVLKLDPNTDETLARSILLSCQIPQWDLERIVTALKNEGIVHDEYCNG